MVIDVTKVKPNYVVELDGVDITEYSIESGNVAPNTKNKISTGNIVLDKNIDSILIPKRLNQIFNFYVQYDNSYKRFGGVISNLVEDKERNSYRITVKSFAWLTYQTTFTGIFRQDAGKGNRKTIITDILTEKFGGIITWTDASFPDVTDAEFDILYKVYNSRKPGDIFDELIYPMDRDWWIDEDGLFFAQPRVYTEVDAPVTLNVNTVGLPTIDVNNNYANIVKIWGKKFEKELTNIFSGTGSTDEFDLDFYPIGSADVEYSDETNISVTMEGNEDYDDPTEFDAYFKQSEQKLKFNVNTVSGTNNIVVKTKVYDQIREEVPRASEIERVGYEIVKEIRNEDITTQEEAYIVGDNYLNNFATDQLIYSVQVAIDSDDTLSKWKTGNAVVLKLDTGVGSFENIVEENWVWTPFNPLSLTLRFVDFARTDNDVLQDLINRIRVQDQQIDNASTNLTRYFYLGANIIIRFQNLSFKSQATDGRFEMQSNSDIWDDRSLMSLTGSLPGGGPAAIMLIDDYATEETVQFSTNAGNIFRESFIDEWFTDADNSNTDLNINTGILTFGNGSVYQSENIFKEEFDIINILFEKTGTLTGDAALKYEIKTNNSDWIEVTEGVAKALNITGVTNTFPLTFPITLGGAAESGNELKYRITNEGVAGSATISDVKITYTS